MNQSAGFSLVEVMCAVVIVGVGLVGLTQGITTAIRSSKESEVQTLAALIAAGQIEMLRADGYVADGETEGSAGEGLAPYRWKQTVSATSIHGLHEVVVVVQKAKTHEDIYELRTLLFDASGLTETSSRRPDATQSKRRNRRSE